jgi:hypothetical protein
MATTSSYASALMCFPLFPERYACLQGVHFRTGQMQPRLRRIHLGAARAAATACKFCSAIVDEYVDELTKNGACKILVHNLVHNLVTGPNKTSTPDH